MGSHVKRWITAIVALPILFSIIYFGNEAVFTIFITAIILGAIVEYNRMMFPGDASWVRWQNLLAGLIIALAAASGDPNVLLGSVTLSILAIFSLHLLRIKEPSFDLHPVGTLVLGVMYISLPLSTFILLRRCEEGIMWIFFVLVIAFSGDVAAYYAGRLFGKKKLFPLVSPGKTVEGTLGLFVGSTLGAVVFAHFFLPLIPLGHAAIMGCVGGILGQVGDLCESVIKRFAGVKDSGSFLVGHGGLLDRLDCLIFITPFVYYYRLSFAP